MKQQSTYVSKYLIVDSTVSKLYAHLIQSYLNNSLIDFSTHQPLYELLTNMKVRGCPDYSEQVSFPEMESLVKGVSRALGSLSFGIDIGRHIHPSDFGIVGYALMNCNTLHQALGVAAEHKHMMNEGFQIQLTTRGEYCRFIIKDLINSPYINPLVEMDFAVAFQIAKFLVGSQKQHMVKIIQVNFQHKPSESLEFYQEYFNCPVKFGQETNELILSRKMLDIPVRSADPRLLKVYMRKVVRMQRQRNTNQATHQRVFIYISSHLDRQIPNMNDVANHFNMSLSTLKKRLQIEGYNYTKICDLVRKNQAIKLVASQTMQLKEIGLVLGFANPSAFNRAFKRWTDITPADYRRSTLVEEVESDV